MTALPKIVMLVLVDVGEKHIGVTLCVMLFLLDEVSVDIRFFCVLGGAIDFSVFDNVESIASGS